MKNTRTTLVVWLLAAALAPATSFAQAPQQTPPPDQPQAQTPQAEPAQPEPAKSDEPKPARVRRPYRGLFGSPADTDSKQSLNVTGSIFGAYDDDTFTGTDTTEFGRSGGYAGLTAGAQYNKYGERLSVGLGGNAAVNRYPASYTSRQTTSMYVADGTFSWKATSRTTISAGTTFTYAPEYRLSLFVSPGSPTGVPDVFNTVAPDYDLFRSSAYRTSAVVRLSQAFGARTSLEAWYTVMDVNYSDNDYDYQSRAVGGRLAQRVTRNAGFHVGYSYATPTYAAAFGPVGTARLHNIDAGIDYSRSLSLSRRTRFGFSTGSTLVVTDQAASGGARDTRYQFIGSADLTREIGRTWTAQLAYRRSVDFREGFAAPFLADGVSGNINGLFSRRLRFSSSNDFSFGTVGIGSSNRFHAYSINNELDFALSRYLATFVRYVYYVYDFDAQVALDPRFTRTFERQGARAGVMASIPLVR